MQLTKNKLKAKWLKITLNGTDTYDIEFTKVKRTLNKLMYKELGIKTYSTELVVIKRLEGYYCDMLVDMFESETGLFTHF